jgi:hypothetical protein
MLTSEPVALAITSTALGFATRDYQHDRERVDAFSISSPDSWAVMPPNASPSMPLGVGTHLTSDIQ